MHPDKVENPFILNLITDRSVCAHDFFVQIESALKGGVTLLQQREKNMSSRDMYYEALKLKSLSDEYGIAFVVNDRLDIALAVGAGLHVGQTDLPADVARRLLGSDKILGVSVSTVSEAKKAEVDGADYIGVGSMYQTDSKENVETISFEDLDAIIESVSIPVLAIGGIKSHNICDFSGTGISGVAVLSEIMGASDPEEKSREIIRNLNTFVYGP